MSTSPMSLSSVALGSGGFVLNGQSAFQSLGYSVSSAGDLNGDGFDDLIISSRSAASGAGATYVVFGRSGGFAASLNLGAVAAGTGGFVIRGQDAGDRSGWSAAAGDVNGDGYADIIIGTQGGASPGNTLPGAGEAYVVFGHASGFDAALDLATVVSGTGGFGIYGAEASDSAERGVSSAGDVNADGFDDVLVGAPTAATFTREA